MGIINTLFVHPHGSILLTISALQSWTIFARLAINLRYEGVSFYRIQSPVFPINFGSSKWWLKSCISKHLKWWLKKLPHEWRAHQHHLLWAPKWCIPIDLWFVWQCRKIIALWEQYLRDIKENPSTNIEASITNMYIYKSLYVFRRSNSRQFFFMQRKPKCKENAK